MKKLFLTIFASALLISVYGQRILNGDFHINSGNNIPFGTPELICPSAPYGGSTASTFADGSVPNWIRTHGTPNFGGPTGGLWPGDHSIFMHDEGGVGEGIAGRYPFMRGRCYRGRIGIKSIDHPSRVRIVVGSGSIPQDLNCQPITCGPESQYSTPSYNSFSPIPIPATVGQVEITLSSLGVGDNPFLFHAFADYDWIAIFPQDQVDCNTTLEVKYVWISPCECIENLFIPPDASAGPVFVPFRARHYGGFKNIFVGSVYGGGAFPASLPVVAHPTLNTILEASQQVTISDNFLAQPTSGFLLAIADPTTCTDPCDMAAISGPDRTCLNGDVFYTSGVPGGTWSTSDPAVAGIFPSGTLDPVGVGVVTITYTVGDCRMTKSVTVIENCEDLWQRRDGNLAALEEPFGVLPDSTHALGFKSLKIYPSPAFNTIIVSFLAQEASEIKVLITDIQGGSIIEKNLKPGRGMVNERINVEALKDGIYFVEITSDTKRAVQKIIKMSSMRN